jgi:DNA polymerase-3 subunit delta
MKLAQNLYLLWGSDAYTLKKATQKILDDHAILKADVEVYDMEEVALTEAIDHAMMIPFLADNKAVILASACFMGGLKPRADISHHLNQLESYLENPNPTTVLIIQAPYEKLDRSMPLYKLITDRAKVIACTQEDGEEFFQEIKELLKEANLRIEANALQMFMSRVGNDRMMLKNELDKLIAFAGEAEVITPEMVREIVYSNPDDHIYLLVNAVIASDTEMLMQIYRELLMANIDELWILRALASKFQEILYTKELLKQNYKQEDIMHYFSVSKGRAYYIMKNARDVSDDRLLELLSRLDELDTNIKTGGIAKDVGLELFLLKLYEE